MSARDLERACIEAGMANKAIMVNIGQATGWYVPVGLMEQINAALRKAGHQLTMSKT